MPENSMEIDNMREKFHWIAFWLIGRDNGTILLFSIQNIKNMTWQNEEIYKKMRDVLSVEAPSKLETSFVRSLGHWEDIILVEYSSEKFSNQVKEIWKKIVKEMIYDVRKGRQDITIKWISMFYLIGIAIPSSFKILLNLLLNALDQAYILEIVPKYLGGKLDVENIAACFSSIFYLRLSELGENSLKFLQYLDGMEKCAVEEKDPLFQAKEAISMTFLDFRARLIGWVRFFLHLII
jgi:hypothetical protein